MDRREAIEMARTWDDVKAEAKARGLEHPELAAEAKRITDDHVRAYRLAEIRKNLGQTQTQLAEAIGVRQARISQIENGDLTHTELATLRSYVEALGGSVEVIADFGGSQMRIA
ncbi:MAG: helix-turn-helix transcriptional regulator [Candidatus Nanopelagicales bacterium]|nr:helix-turn-helix transcriptional regulator [Candidatus Nanopelagicales bacterium]MDZ4248883.1 helix-turn-helix transcriptional regulator [Candidatus Nanopelagicales bacterium]